MEEIPNCPRCEKKNKLLFESALHYSTAQRHLEWFQRQLELKDAEIFRLRMMIRSMLQQGSIPAPKDTLSFQ